MAQATAHKSNISKTIDLSENAIKFRNFWVGICRSDPGTLSLYQS